eukprot:scaffold4510_cov183-Amphora_coffeaeformis.AAC.1
MACLPINRDISRSASAQVGMVDFFWNFWPFGGNQTSAVALLPHVDSPKRPRESSDCTVENIDSEETSNRKRRKLATLTDDLVCPITLELPIEPVMAEDGRIFERSAIEEYFETCKPRRKVRSPLLNKTMGKRLIPAVQTRNHIHTLIQNGMVEESLSDSWNARVKAQDTAKILLKQAEERNETAMKIVYKKYLAGTDYFKKDPKNAFKWCNKMHDAGILFGTYSVGAHFIGGVGTKKNLTRGLKYMRMAAEKGSVHATFKLGMWLSDGKYGMPVDLEEATKWLQTSLKPALRSNEEYKRLAQANPRHRGIVREKAVLGRAGHVDDVTVLLGFLVLVSGLSHHDGRIDVDGVRRILDGRDDAAAKHLLQTHNVTLGTVGHKDFIWFNQAIVKIFGNLFTQGGHALFGTISRVPFLGSQLAGTGHETSENVLGDGLRRVTDTQRDDTIRNVRVLRDVFISSSTDFGKEVTTGQLGKIRVSCDAGMQGRRRRRRSRRVGRDNKARGRPKGNGKTSKRKLHGCVVSQ